MAEAVTNPFSRKRPAATLPARPPPIFRKTTLFFATIASSTSSPRRFSRTSLPPNVIATTARFKMSSIMICRRGESRLGHSAATNPRLNLEVSAWPPSTRVRLAPAAVTQKPD